MLTVERRHGHVDPPAKLTGAGSAFKRRLRPNRPRLAVSRCRLMVNRGKRQGRLVFTSGGGGGGQ